MEFSDEWKSLWPISSSHSPPLLISKRRRIDNSSINSPIFKPCNKTLIPLLKSPIFSPNLPPQIPNFTLPRFLQTSAPILPSTASSIAAQFAAQLPDPAHNFNALQLLNCKKPDSTIGLFPTGQNYDQIGFFVLTHSNKNQLTVEKFKHGNSFIVHNHKLNSRILRLLVNPVDEIQVVFGFVLVLTMYSVHWYSVKKGGNCGVVLDYMGCAEKRVFKGCVVHACWSPHLSEECVVLLESGDLFLFDVGCLKSRTSDVLRGEKLRVKLDKDEEWVSCEFSWHPRILLVASSSEVFLVDLRSEKGNVCTLLKIEAVALGKKDRFLVLSRVESDPFCFALVSSRVLVLCDVRNPLMPLIKWVHGINNPSYVTHLRFSDMMASSREDKLVSAGRCMLVGSFWNCEFSMFCYGPGSDHSASFPDISRLSKSVYAWGQPSWLSVSGRDCYCGNCLLRADFLKSSCFDWIDWRQKQVFVLGFGILNKVISIESDDNDTDDSVGFMLVRLTSCGTLEAQRYSAAWDSEERSESFHGGEKSRYSENNLLYDKNVIEKELKKKPYFVTLDYLKEYLNGKLTKTLGRKFIENQKNSRENYAEFHGEICEKLIECGITRVGLSQTLSDVIKDVSLPASIYEIALENICASFPNKLLGMAFGAFMRFPEVPLKPNVGSDNLYPLPFPLHKRCTDNTSGEALSPSIPSYPMLPPPFLVALNNFRKPQREILPLDEELRLQSDKVMKVAWEIGLSHSVAELGDGYSVSLDADTEDLGDVLGKKKPLHLYIPSTSDYAISKGGSIEVEPDKRFTTFIFKKHPEPISGATKEISLVDLFDKGCPIELKFNDSSIMQEAIELEPFKFLKQKDLDFQKNFQLYQEFLSGCK